jgi:hypothetical protein
MRGDGCSLKSVPAIRFTYTLYPILARRRFLHLRQDSMATFPPRSNGASSPESSQTLTDRVQARVDEARLAIERRAGATRPKARRRQVPSASPSTSIWQLSEEARQNRSLRRVFREMGVSYRRYRSQTKEPVTPGLRDAAYNFRAEPSLTSLVAVAAYLDELDLLS